VIKLCISAFEHWQCFEKLVFSIFSSRLLTANLPHVYMHLQQPHGSVLQNKIYFLVIQSILVGGVKPTPLWFCGLVDTAGCKLNYHYYKSL
jgi:hypothetical protein